MNLLWQQIPNTIISEIYCNSNFSGIVLDTEHSVWNNESLFQHIQFITTANKLCFVRLTEINNTLIRLCLDSGADGLIFSTIENIDQAKEIRNLCHYKHSRGLGLVRENQWGGKPFNLNKTPILIAQIETYTGVANLKFLYDKCNFNLYMIGPYDLSRSLGCPGDFNNKEYNAYIKIYEEQIPKFNRAIHLVKREDIAKQWSKYKQYGLKCFSMDTILLKEGLQNLEHWT